MPPLIHAKRKGVLLVLFLGLAVASIALIPRNLFNTIVDQNENQF